MSCEKKTWNSASDWRRPKESWPRSAITRWTRSSFRRKAMSPFSCWMASTGLIDCSSSECSRALRYYSLMARLFTPINVSLICLALRWRP